MPLLTLLRLDRLNNQNDPQPDGVFDYVENFTVNSSQSRIIFPVLEPFGHDLDYIFTSDPTLRSKYLYYPLYDTIKAIASTYANLDRFLIKGQAKTGSVTGDIPLNAYNIPQGSVKVLAGGQVLQENVDYTIDYIGGTIRIINQSIRSSGLPISVNFENNATFGVQQRTYMGLRWDYLVNRKFSFGGTMVRLSERPFFTKMDYGTDPIRNSMVGMDASYQNELPRLTKWLGKLPNYRPSGSSTINAFAEAAEMIPGHAPQIGRGSSGVVYMDDFEGTKASIDLRFPLISWALASTPHGATDRNGNILFPESDLFDNIDYGKNRAKLAWYNIEPILQERRSPNNPLSGNLTELSDPRVRAVSQLEIFPRLTPDFGRNQLVTFDLAYYPKDKGPYNYSTTGIDASGKLQNPRTRWGGMMRSIDQTDFETANIEFIEFWVLDPFIKNTNPKGGSLYFNLGNISEDVLKDSRRFYENGLPTPAIPAQIQSSKWGRQPVNPIQVTQAFSNDPNDRPFQDVGFDGLQDSAELTVRKSYLDDLASQFGNGSQAYRDALADPSGDNFRFYRDQYYDANSTGILGRYKQFNNPQGNSPVATAGSNFASSSTMYPDGEDLNHDNTLTESEEYFQYRVDLRPPGDAGMQVGQNFIVDRKSVNVTNADGSKEDQIWYQFRVPVSEYDKKVGEIPDFKSIRFFRMFMTDFEDSTVLRFAKLELVRNNWRRFTYALDTTGQYKPVDVNGTTTFNVSAVNIEENDRRDPIPYRTPPGIERVQSLSNGGINILQNEQALSMAFCNLKDGDSRAVFKNISYDLRQYKKMLMFLHAESVRGQATLKDGDLYAVIRVGNDYINNFYEIRYPLKVTPFGTTDPAVIWPEENSLDYDMTTLVNLKIRRNLSNADPTKVYREIKGDRSVAIIGNPNLGEVKGVLIGIENVKGTTSGAPLCAEVWVNELRLSGINESGGWAAVGQINMQLADLGTLSVAGNRHTFGFGQLEQRVNERFRDDFSQVDLAANLQLGKLLPRRAMIEIPFFASYSRIVSSPQFDPYDKDVILKNKLKAYSGAAKDSIRNEAVDFTSIKTINLTNVRRAPSPNKRPKLWSISNFDLSYSYTSTLHHNPLIESNQVVRHQGGIGYTFNNQPKFKEPFKKSIKSGSKWVSFIKGFNINPLPNLIGIRWDARRQFGAIRPRNVGGGPFKIPETYDKFFVFDRLYNVRWDLTKSFNVDFKALNNARVDEPYGRIDTKDKQDSVWRNFLKGGRNTMYNQSLDLTYNLPTSLIPLLNWTTANVSYRTTYGWIGASRLAVELGNSIQNSNQKAATVELNFAQLYSKSKFLRRINEPAAMPSPDMTDPSQQAKKDTAKGKGRKRAEDAASAPMNGFVKAGLGLLTAVKRIGATYGEGASTFLPGYMDSTKFLGQNWNSMAPGLDFVFGRQPDSNWLYNAGKKGLISKDEGVNNLYRQTYDRRFAINAQLEPFRDLIIDVNLDKTLTKTYSTLFKDTLGGSNFALLNPYSGGGFSISYIAFQTLFQKTNPNNLSETFKTFQNNRIILSERLGVSNPYSQVKGSDGYYKGYGRYAQDVLIPSFIAAYTKKDPMSVALLKTGDGNYVRANPFTGFVPLPNWRLTYNGLTRVPGMDRFFTSFTLTHAYNSTLGMNSFNSALLFEDTLYRGFPSFLDTTSGNFIPYFLIPNVTITEQFAPLVGIDFSTRGQFSGRLIYGKSRTLSLSLIDYQLSEVRSTEMSVGVRWRKRGFPLPFTIRLSKKAPSKKLDNDITFTLDFGIRDDVTSNSRLDQTNAFATAGQRVITIKPTIDYVLSNRINLQLYFDQRRVNPYISSSAPSVNTRAGLQIRISLAQ